MQKGKNYSVHNLPDKTHETFGVHEERRNLKECANKEGLSVISEVMKAVVWWYSGNFSRHHFTSILYPPQFLTRCKENYSWKAMTLLFVILI